MSAYIVKLTKEESDVLKSIMGRAGSGMIYIHPEQDEKLKAHGIDIPDGELVDYDFGGEPDCYIDRLNFCSLDAILDHLQIEDRELTDKEAEADGEDYGTTHEKIKRETTDGKDDNRGTVRHAPEITLGRDPETSGLARKSGFGGGDERGGCQSQLRRR